MEEYKYPGQFEHDGIVYNSVICQESLVKIREELTLDSDDFVLVTYPKTGTLWMSEIYYQLTVPPEQQDKTGHMMGEDMTIIEFLNLADKEKPTPYESIVNSPPPRKLRTHLDASYFKRVLEDKEHCPKFLVVLRNPKDTLASFYHFHRMMKGYNLANLSWNDFFEMYKRNALYYGDVIDHQVGWWRYKSHPKVLIISYEELLENGAATIRQVADFLDISASDEDIKRIVEESSFEQMQTRGIGFYTPHPQVFDETISPFIRKGKKGDWRTLFTSEQSAYIDNMIALKATPLGLNYSF